MTRPVIPSRLAEAYRFIQSSPTLIGEVPVFNLGRNTIREQDTECNIWTEEVGKLQNDVIRNVYSLLILLYYDTKKDNIGWTCSKHADDGKFLQYFS